MTSFENHSELPDDGIIRKVLAGDRDAYAVLVRRYERQVHAAAWAILRNHQAAEDVSQDAFIRAYEKLGTLRTPERFGPWLLTIVRRLSVDLARCRSPLVLVSACPEGPSFDTSDGEDAARILAAIARMPDRDQQVLLLRYFDQLGVAEIASRMGCPVGTITKLLSRAVTRLRHRFQEPS